MHLPNKLSGLLRNVSLRTKFMLILLLAMLLVSLSAFIVFRIPYSSYDEQLYKSSVQMSTLFADKIQSELDDIVELSFRILADNVLQENLSLMKSKPPGTVAWVEAKQEVADRVGYFGIWFSSAITLQLKTAGGATFYQAFGNAATADELTPERIAYAANRYGRDVWLAQEGQPAKLYLLREIRNIKRTPEALATMLIQMDLNSVVEKYRASMSRLGVPLSAAIYGHGIRLYATDERVSSLPEGEDGYTYMRLQDQDALCVRYTAPNGWRYVTLVDYSRINEHIGKTGRLTIWLTGAAILLALALSAWLIVSLLRHLKVLLHKFDDFARTGHPMPEKTGPYITRRDEIGRLHRHFDQMTRDYDRITQNNYEQQRLIQEKQMQQLRAQVRPHFLYNTLASIYCLAQSAQDQRIATMTDALGKMLRASLSDSRDMVTLEDDLQTAREYLRIQLIRYGGRLRVLYDIDDSFLLCRLPGMTLQPLIENAVHHALEEMLDVCVIRVSTKATGGAFDLIVEDNGPGVDENILEKLESGEIKPEGLGIGMRNIHRRVQYAFSADYGIRVKSEPGHTRIIVRLPDTRGEQEETDV